MADIVVDEDYLRTTGADLDNLSTDLYDICQSLRGLDGLVVGAAPVFDEIHEFAGQWSQAAEGLSTDATRAADYVRQVIAVFDEVDLRIAAQLVNAEAAG